MAYHGTDPSAGEEEFIALARHEIASGGGSWGNFTCASTVTTDDKRNPSLDMTGGVCVWEEYRDVSPVSTRWRIMASIRGDTTTLVAGDTDRVHPHVCCESTYVSPSTSRLTVHLLWTDWVGFEVDSAVYDSGVTRYEVFEFDVSNAEELATASNNGTKLLLEPNGDSLFCVFRDSAGAVVYARSADGTSWERETVASDREYPCLFQDSAGRRWMVCIAPLDIEDEEPSSRVEAYWLSGDSWSGPLVVQEVPENEGELVAVSGAGGSSASSSCGYAAMYWVREGADRLVVAKFDTASVLADTQDVYAVQHDGPCIAAEPGASGDNLHLVWSQTQEVVYTMTTAPVHPDSWSAGSIDWEEPLPLSEGQADAPVVAADGERVVVGWVAVVPATQETDIFCCWRATDTTYDGFGSPLNLSAESTLASNYPVITIADDTVLVAWTEEKDGEPGYDICASINRGDAVRLVQNAENPSYPHVQYQEPYVHAVWTESPEPEQHLVGYRKVHPDSCTGGGQGAGRLAGLRPLLYACRPNPFTGKTAIRYQFPKAGHVRLQVHDVAGRVVRTLRDGYQAAGIYTVTWDGRANDGRQVANGVYFYRLAAPTFEDVKKAVVMR